MEAVYGTPGKNIFLYFSSKRLSNVSLFDNYVDSERKKNESQPK